MDRKIAIYSRKSKFTGKGESIENQVEMCRAKVKIMFPQVQEEDILVFEDEGYSGGNTNRPQFQNMMKAVRNNEIMAVVSYKLDRVSRSVADFANMYDELGKMNASYISATEAYETTTPIGRAMMGIATVFAQLERETIAERIRDNMYALAKSGRWLGGTTPTGYQSVSYIGSVSDDGRERKAKKLELVEKEAEIVKLIFSKFLETKSLTQTETYLIQNGIKTKNEKNFTRFAIKGILHNAVYTVADELTWSYFQGLNTELCGDKKDYNGKHGLMIYNKTVQVNGSVHYDKNYEEWIVSVGKHKPIINSSDWIETQKLLNQNSDKSYRKPKSNVALLSGFLYCGDCGSFMRPKLSSRKNSDGEFIYTYLCELKERSKRKNCDIKRPNGNILDRMVCDEIKKLSGNDSNFIKDLEKAQREIAKSSRGDDQQIEFMRKRIEKNEKEINSLVISLTKAVETPAYDYINSKINELHQANEDMKERMSQISTMKKDTQLSKDEIKFMKNLLCSFANSFDSMNVEEKRNALRTFIRKIVWDGENIHIYFFGSDDESGEFLSENGEPLRVDSKRGAHVFQGP